MLWSLLSVLLALFCVFLTVLYWRCRYEKVPISVQEADDQFQEHETAPVSFNPTQDEIRDSQQYESAASSTISSESLQEEGDNFQEDSSCEDSSSVVEQYLTENRRYKAIQFLPRIGSRKNKSWCLVEPSNCPDSERQMFTVVKTDRSFSIALSNKMKAVSKLAGTLKHPYLQPIREIEYAEDSNAFVTVHPFVARGSLKDIIYQTDPCTSWVQKQGRMKGSGLPQNKVALYGRQLLQVIHFLYEAGLFPLASLHSANVFLEDEDTCRLSGYENALLGYKVDVDREYMPHIDAIMFGRLLYEMSCGCLPQSLIPVEADLRAIVDRDLLEVLHLMFNMDAREGHFAALDHDEVVGLSFFQNVAHLVKHNPEQDLFTEVTELLKEVQTCESIVAEPDIFTEEAKQHFAQAVKKNGTIRVKLVTVLLVGAAGAGKTHFKHVLFGLDPPRVRNSTPVAENPLQAISVDFGTSEAAGVGGVCLWRHVSHMEYDEVLAKEMLLQSSEATNECSDDAQSLSTESGRFHEKLSVSLQGNTFNNSHGSVDSITDAIANLDPNNAQSVTALTSIDESQASNTPHTLNSNSGSSMIPSSLDISQAADSSVNVEPNSSGESSVASGESISDLELNHTLLELLKQPNNTKGIANADWVHLIDTGGQPRCLQLIHAFIKHVSATALVTKLSERLDDFPMIETVVDGERICQAYLSSLNNEQIIKYCLQMVKSRGTSKSVNTLLVGTHSDQENESEGIAEKDRKLSKDLQNDLIHYRAGNPDQLIFPLNCLNPEKKDLEVAQQFRQFVMKTAEHFTRDIPVLWYALNHLLHQYEVKYGTGVIEMGKCKKIAEHYLNMDPATVANALAYLSTCHLILYFPDVLPDIVFCNIQVLLNILNQIVAEVDSLHEGSSGPVSPEHIRELRNKGILAHKVAAQFECRNFGADDLLKLLEHFLIISKLDDHRYFMPVLLRDLPTEDLTEYRTHHPLVVYSPDGWLPCGVFTSIVAFLQGKTSCKYNSIKKQHRNCVSFDLPSGVPGCLTLIDCYQYFEVHVTSREFKTSIFDAIYGIFDGLEEAVSLFYEGLLYEPGFLCTVCSSKHIAELSKGENYWKCTVDGTVGDNLNEQQLLWLESIKGYKRCKSLPASRYNELASGTDPEIALKVFRTLRRDLAKTIKLPDVFANELYSKGIITEGVKSKACDEYNGLDAARRNIAILDAIEAWLRRSSDNFLTLLEAFAESDTAACHFARQMNEELNNEMEKKGLIPAVQFEECSLAYNNQSQSLSAEDCSAKTAIGESIEDLQAQLSNDLGEIQMKFAALLSNTRQSLSSCEPCDVATCAMDLSFNVCNVSSNEKIPLLRDHKDELLKAKSIKEIFNILTSFWSFFDYDLLEHIIKECDSDKRCLMEYEDALKEFCKRRVTELPQNALASGNASNTDKIWVKVDLKNPTLQQVRNLKGRIAQILEVPVSALFLNDIQSGCVQLEFLLPQYIATALFPLTVEQIHNLQHQANVLKVQWRNGENDLKTLFEMDTMSTDETITTTTTSGQTSAPGSGKESQDLMVKVEFNENSDVTQGESADDYKEYLQRGEVNVAYSRVVLLGPGGVGKSSLLHGLMKEPLPLLADSTQFAETHLLRPSQQFWLKHTDSEDDFWCPVTDSDEVKELAGLVVSVAKSQPGVTKMLQDLNEAVATKAFANYVPANFPPDISPQDVVFEPFYQESQKIVQDVFNEVEKVLKENPDLKPPKSEILIRVWDCGGQPVYLDMMASFLTSRAMYLLLYDASRKLHDKCLALCHKGGKVVKAEHSLLSTLELLSQWMAMIDTTLSHRRSSLPAITQNQADAIPKFPRIIPVGTHGDLTPSHKEEIIQVIESECGNKPFTHLLQKGVIVDNTTAGKAQEDPGFKYIRKEVRDLTCRHLEVPTPVAWVLFRRVLQKFLGNTSRCCPVVTYAQAAAISEACGIPKEVFPSVLNFYHELTIFLHYASIPSLAHYVFAIPQWLAKQLALLLALEGFESTGNRMLWDSFRTKGILTQSLYEAVWKESNVNPKSLIDLLEHFLLLSPIYPPLEVCAIKGMKYFVPSVLPYQSADQVESGITPSLRSTCLHLTFSTQYVPPGYFSRLITALNSRGCRVSFEGGVYRNQLSLRYAHIDSVTVTELATSVKIDATRKNIRKPHHHMFSVSCQNFLKLMKSCSLKVEEWIPGIEMQGSFPCSMCSAKGKEHFIPIPANPTIVSDFKCGESSISLSEEQKLWLPPEMAPCGHKSVELGESCFVVDAVSKQGKIPKLFKQLEVQQPAGSDPRYLMQRWIIDTKRMKVHVRNHLIHALQCIDMSAIADKLAYGELLDETASVFNSAELLSSALVSVDVMPHSLSKAAETLQTLPQTEQLHPMSEVNAKQKFGGSAQVHSYHPQRSDFSAPLLLSADPIGGSQAAFSTAQGPQQRVQTIPFRDTNCRAIEEHIDRLATTISSQSTPERFGSYLVAKGFLDSQTMNNKLDVQGYNPYRSVQKLVNVVVNTIECANSPEASAKHFDSFVSIIREDLQLKDLAHLLKRSAELKVDAPSSTEAPASIAAPGFHQPQYSLPLQQREMFSLLEEINSNPVFAPQPHFSQPPQPREMPLLSEDMSGNPFARRHSTQPQFSRYAFQGQTETGQPLMERVPHSRQLAQKMRSNAPTSQEVWFGLSKAAERLQDIKVQAAPQLIPAFPSEQSQAQVVAEPKPSAKPSDLQSEDSRSSAVAATVGSRPAPQANLPKPKLKDALKILLPFRDDWQTIGALLEMEEEKLSAIQHKKKDVSKNCLRVMLDVWLKSTAPPPSWQALADAVESIDSDTADKMRRDYINR